MKLPGTSNIRRLVIAAILIILLSTALLFWGQDVIREVVVMPLSYLYWVISVLVSTTPQLVFWIIVLLIGLMIAYHSLTKRKQKIAPRSKPKNGIEPGAFITGRSVFWANKADRYHSGLNGYGESNFHYAVIRLLVDMIAYRYRLPVRTAEEQIRSGMIHIPPEVIAYIQSNQGWTIRPKMRLWVRAWRWLLEFVRSLWQKITTDSANTRQAELDPQLAFILKYMEEELEVQYDDAGL